VIPCDVRIYQTDGPTKNKQFREMLAMACERGFSPSLVLFEAWYSGLDNLKAIRELGWPFLTRLAANRRVNPDRAGHAPVSAVEVGPAGRVVQLKGFGLIRLFRTVSRDGRVEHWATSRLEMSAAERTA
jgi:putative transposase